LNKERCQSLAFAHIGNCNGRGIYKASFFFVTMEKKQLT